MEQTEGLPGGWVELRLAPLKGGAGFGPALGWIAGVLASGGSLWPWPHLGQFFLGLFLVTAVWGRLWTLFGQGDGLSSSVRRTLRSRRRRPSILPNKAGLELPYTTPDSLSAAWGTALRQAWGLVWITGQRHHRWLVEVLCLGSLLLVLTGLWGTHAFVTGLSGLALLGLLRLLRNRPIARALVRALGGLAWPWWLGHVAWAPLNETSLLLSLLWGLAYTAWAGLARETAAVTAVGGAFGVDLRSIRRALGQIDLAQAGVLVFFLLAGRPLIGGALAFTLLGQVLLQAGLLRTDRWAALARKIWPFAAAGLILTGLALGGWV